MIRLPVVAELLDKTVFHSMVLTAIAGFLVRALILPGYARYSDLEIRPDPFLQYEEVSNIWIPANMLGGGYSTPFYHTSLLPIAFLLKVMGIFAGTAEDLAVKSLFFFIVANSGWAGYYMARISGLSSRLAVLSGVFYMVNRVIGFRFPVHVWIALGYSFLPFAVASFMKMTKEASISSMILAALATSATLWSYYPVGIIALLCNLAYLFFTLSASSWSALRTLVSRIGRQVGVFVALLIVMNAFWASIPLSIILEKQTLSFYVPSSGEYQYWSRNSVLYAARLFSIWSYPLFANASPLGIFAWSLASLIPVLVVTLPMLRIRDQRDWFFIAIALVSMILAAGWAAPPPFNYANLLIVRTIPFGSVFRDSSKFLIVTAMAYAYLAPRALGALWIRLWR